MIRRPPRSTQSRSSAASDVYKRQPPDCHTVQYNAIICRTFMCSRHTRTGAPGNERLWDTLLIRRWWYIRQDERMPLGSACESPSKSLLVRVLPVGNAGDEY